MATISSIVVPHSQWPERSSVSSCQSCGKSFGFFNQREHCQCCGRVCCASTCLENRVAIPGLAGGAPLAVCDACASTVRRARQDAEVAIERCHILEQLLNEQTLQSEKLMGQSKALRVENDHVLKEKERLAAQLRKTEIELEVAAARAALKDGASPSASPANAPTFASVAPSSSSTANAVSDDQLAAFEKKKKQLDMREATLQEALKKVSADAAKLVSQRTALQEKERQYKETLTRQFETTFSEERAKWESLYTQQMHSLTGQFQDWVEAAQRLQSSQALPDQTIHDAPTSGAVPEPVAAPTDAAIIAAAVREAEDALRESHAMELADLQRELEDYRQEVNALNERLVHAANAQAQEDKHDVDAMREEVEEVKRDIKAQLAKEKQRWEDDRLILENTIEALKRRLEDEKTAQSTQDSEALRVAMAQVEALQQQVNELTNANNELAESSETKMRQVMAQISEMHRTTSQEVQHLTTLLDEEKQKAEAERSELNEAHKSRIAELEQALAAASADDTEGTIKALQEQCAARAEALQTLQWEREAEKDALQRSHQDALAEVERRFTGRIAQLESELDAAQRATAAAEEQAQQHVAAAEAARKAVEKASSTPPAMHALFAAFLEDTRLAQRVMLTEHAQAIYTAKESLVAMATRSLKARQEEQAAASSTTQALKRQLASAKRQSKEYEARAEEQAREALQNKRDAVTAKEELVQIREKLRRLQQQQRNQSVSVSSNATANAVPSAAGSQSRGRGQPHPASGVSGSDEVSGSALEALLHEALTWIEARQALLLGYVEVMQRGPLADMSGQFSGGFEAMVDEVERRREQCRRNALALERTTSTIKELQQDLRLRTERVDAREAALEDGEAKLKTKKERIAVLCRSLRTVTQKLREKQVALSQEEADAEAAAAQEAQELDAPTETT